MFDGIIYLISGIFILIAFLRGFIKEFLSIIGQISSIIITYQFNEYFAKMFLDNIITNKTVSSVLSCIMLYIACIIIFWILTTVISIALVPIRLGFIDRFFGILLGLAKSYIVCFAIYIAIMVIYPMLDESIVNENNKKNKIPYWMEDSKTYIVFKFTQNIIDQILQDAWIDDFIGSIQQKIDGKKDASIDKKKIEKNNNIEKEDENNLSKAIQEIDKKIQEEINIEHGCKNPDQYGTQEQKNTEQTTNITIEKTDEASTEYSKEWIDGNKGENSKKTDAN